MKRFFEFLLPERTHLKAVIAALVAIFLLSGVLAYQVHNSIAERARAEEAQMEAYQMMTVRALAKVSEHWTSGAIFGAFKQALDAAEAGADADSVTRAIRPDRLCKNCEAARAATVRHFDLSDNHEASTTERRLIADLRNAQAEAFKLPWLAGAFANADEGRITVYAFMRDGRKGHHDAWVIELPGRFLQYADSMVIADNTVFPPELLNGKPVESFLFMSAEYGGVPIASSLGGKNPSSISTGAVQSGFFPGMKFNAGVLPLGRQLLIPRHSNWLSPNLLIAVMVLIASVIFMAIALVRREEELHRLRSDLISGVSHELRTPLAQIRMFAETLLLGRTRTEAERRRSLEVIDQEAKRLSHFVENMLQFAKGEGGRTRLAPEPTSFAIEVRRAVESFAPMCSARGVEVRTELEDGVTAPVDRAALRRIMLNLMENALKYGPDEQRITVGVAIFNDVVRLWVDDEGEGIPRLDRERVFDSFYRLNRDLDRRVTGSGIGLAVVRQLATLHSGRAWAEEAPGGGARLVVEFPDAYVRPVEEGSGWAVA